MTHFPFTESLILIRTYRLDTIATARWLVKLRHGDALLTLK